MAKRKRNRCPYCKCKDAFLNGSCSQCGSGRNSRTCGGRTSKKPPREHDWDGWGYRDIAMRALDRQEDWDE